MCSENEWERICEESAEFENRCTFRMRIEGGSLYRYELNTPISANSRALCISMVFVPDPAPPALALVGVTEPDGTVAIAAPWPAGVPSGFTIVLQHWIVDAAGPSGFAASNAISGTTP